MRVVVLADTHAPRRWRACPPRVAAELRGEQVLIEPFQPSPGCTVAFIFKDGAVIEFMNFDEDSDLPWK